MTQLEYIIKELEKCCPYSREIYNSYNSGRYGLIECIRKEMGEFANDKAEDCIDEYMIEDILNGMSGYLRHYIAIPAFKQKKWVELNNWVRRLSVESESEIDMDEMVLEYMPEPVHSDTYASVVKCLHAIDASKGMTKEEMAVKIGVSKKAIQNTLHLLDPSLNEDGKKLKRREKKETNKKKVKQKRNTPRFAGQLIQIPIEYEDIKETINYSNTNSEVKDRNVHRKSRRYYTPDTCHLVGLQMNVTQVGIMLKGLQTVFDSEISYNSVYLALNVWTQLSDYCKDRLERVFPGDHEFHNFLNNLKEIENGKAFVTEREMFDEERTVEAKLGLVYKGSAKCDIKIKGVAKVIRGCQVNFDYDDEKFHIYYENKDLTVAREDILDILLIR